MASRFPCARSSTVPISNYALRHCSPISCRAASAENFTRVANARTFGFFKDVEYLHSHGLARGGSLESVVVLDDNGVMNPEGLRYKDEFVRHKVLDFIGDMAMLGMPIQGQFEICCSGHQLNNAFLRKAESERALQLIDLSLEEAQNRKTREKRPAYEGSLALA